MLGGAPERESPMPSRTNHAVLQMAILLGLPGCAGMVNPSFPVSMEDARADLQRMRETPRVLERPVVVLAGYLDPGLGSAWLAWKIRNLTGDSRVIGVDFFSCSTFDDCRARVIEEVSRAFPSADPEETTEVDVIGMSMGGVVARHAAVPERDGTSSKRLKVARLFTIGSPHRGANMAALPSFHSLHLSMRVDSSFMSELNAEYRNADYKVYSYVRLGDSIVGVENAAPPGETPWWVSGGLCPSAHIGAVMDPRIQSDIARRLRAERPFSTVPALDSRDAQVHRPVVPLDPSLRYVGAEVSQTAGSSLVDLGESGAWRRQCPVSPSHVCSF